MTRTHKPLPWGCFRCRKQSVWVATMEYKDTGKEIPVALCEDCGEICYFLWSCDLIHEITQKRDL